MQWKSETHNSGLPWACQSILIIFYSILHQFNTFMGRNFFVLVTVRHLEFVIKLLQLTEMYLKRLGESTLFQFTGRNSAVNRITPCLNYGRHCSYISPLYIICSKIKWLIIWRDVDWIGLVAKREVYINTLTCSLDRIASTAKSNKLNNATIPEPSSDSTVKSELNGIWKFTTAYLRLLVTTNTIVWHILLNNSSAYLFWSHVLYKCHLPCEDCVQH